MLAASVSQGSRPGARTNFIAIAAVIKKAAMVAKIAMPPPRGMMVRWYLSTAGRATKPVLSASFRTIAVRMTETANEPESKIAAGRISLSILTAPINAVLPY